MIVLSIVLCANLIFTAYLLRENKRLVLLVIAKSPAEFLKLNTKIQKSQKKDVSENDSKTSYHTWRTPSEGVGP
jgi:hypothetical protein